MAYPTSLDSFSTKVDGVDYPKASHINSLQTAVEALEAKVGVDSSAVPTSIDYIIKNNIWPIGSVFTAVVSTDPSVLLGFGTWSRIAQGRMLVGQNDSDSDFNTAEETGGAKTVDLSHTHTGPSHTHTGPSHTHSFTHTHNVFRQAAQSSGAGLDSGSNYLGVTNSQSTATTGAEGTGATGSGGTGATGSGGSATQTVMNPYFTVYFWKRTA